MNTRQQVARSMIWTGLESFGISGLSVIGLVVVARLVTPSEIGVAAMAQGIVQLLNVPVEFLFSDALIRRRNNKQIDFDTAYSFSVALGIVICVLCWLSSDSIARFFDVPQMGPVLAWMSLGIPAMGFGTVIASRQRRNMEFKTLALRSFIGRLCGVSIGILVAYYGGGVWSLVAQQVLMVTLATVVLWVTSKERPSFDFSWPHFIHLSLFGIRSVINLELNFSIQRIFMLLVGSGIGTTAVGYLNLAFRSVDILRDVVTNAAAQLALPLFSRHSNNPADIKRIYNTAVKFTCLITFPLFAGLAVCSSDFIKVVFGPQWDAATPYFTFLSVLTLAHFARLYSNSIMVARGFPHYPLLANLASLTVVLLGMLTVGQNSLAMAAAIWGVRLAVSLPIDMRNLKKVSHMGYLEQLKGIALPLLTGLFMMLCLYLERILFLTHLSPFPRLFVMILSGAFIFLTAIWIADRERVKDLWNFALSGFKNLQTNPAPYL